MANNDIALMAHLMRRAGFGATYEELERRAAKGYEATVEELLNPESEPDLEMDVLERHFIDWKEMNALEVNQAYCDFLGHSPADLIGRHFDLVIHENDLPEVCERLDRLLAGKLQGYHHERRYRHKDGHVMWGLAALSLLLDSEGMPTWFQAQVLNITERKRKEEALKKTDELFKRSERLAKLGHWEWDEVEDRCIFCSDEMARLHGISASEYLRRAGTFE